MIEQRVGAIGSSCGRARGALFVATIVSATVLMAVWNTYFTWSRHWVGLPDAAAPAGAKVSDAQKALQKLQLQNQARAFMENKDINLGLLGIRVSSDDIPILGGLALCVISLYQVLALRRANRDIASVLIEAQRMDAAAMRTAYFGIRPELVFNAQSARDKPVDRLDYEFKVADPDKVRLAPAIRVLIYLPALASAVALLSDVYYATVFTGEFDLNYAVPVWSALPLALKGELVALDAVAAAIGFLTWRYNRASLAHILGSFTLMARFAQAYEKRFGRSIYEPLEEAGRSSAAVTA